MTRRESIQAICWSMAALMLVGVILFALR